MSETILEKRSELRREVTVARNIQAKILADLNDYLMNYNFRSSSHLWGKPTILTLKFHQHSLCARIVAVCSRCGSERRMDVDCNFGEKMEWYLFAKGYKNPKDFKSSQCYLEDEHSAKQKQVEEEKKLIKERHMIWEKEKSRNYRIIENMRSHLGRERRFSAEYEMARLRRDLAIYRLYRYLNTSLREISHETRMDPTRIMNIIGAVFKDLCISDTSCVFRNILSGDKQIEVIEK